jgi:hypothetical protein
MKRDLDVCRTILLWMEKKEHALVNELPQIDGLSKEFIGFQIHLLGEAGLIKAADTTFYESTSPQAIPLHITWAGYEFLEAAKDDGLWSKAKTSVIKPAGGVAFDVLLDWLKSEAKNRLGLP